MVERAPRRRRARSPVARRARRALDRFRDELGGPAPSASIATSRAAPSDEDDADAESRPRRDDADADDARGADVAALRSALTCVITNALFVDPVTTACGHTFERDALARWLTRGERERAAGRDGRGRVASGEAPASCPQCRSPLYHELPHEWPVNTTVRECVEATFGREAALGEAEARREANARGEREDDRRGRDGGEGTRRRRAQDEAWVSTRGNVNVVGPTYELPMFFLEALVPGQEVTLNVFEAKYKVLVRRCLSGSRKFLMMTNEDSNEEHYLEDLEDDDATAAVSRGVADGYGLTDVDLAQFGRFCAECQIVTCQELVDGRFLVRIRAMRHVFVHSAVKDPSGFIVARCSRVRDEINADLSVLDNRGFKDDSELRKANAAAVKLELRIDRVLELFDVWVAMTIGPRWLYNYGGSMSQLLQAVGPSPRRESPSDLAWWIVRVLNPLPTIDGTIEMRSICLNTSHIDTRFQVIAQMLIYSLSLVQRINVRDWTKREHVVAVSVCNELFAVLSESPSDAAGDLRRERLVEDIYELLYDVDFIEHEAYEGLRICPPGYDDPQGVAAKSFLLEKSKRPDPSKQTDSKKAQSEQTKWSDYPPPVFDAVMDRLIWEHGYGALALAAWRALSDYERGDPKLKRWNERLLAHCPSSINVGTHVKDTNELLRLSRKFSKCLRRDMRCGFYKFLYLFDLCRMLVYLVYRVLVLVIFALGFLFELAFDREFHGGHRTAARGLFMAVAIGAASGLFARSSLDAYLGRVRSE